MRALKHTTPATLFTRTVDPRIAATAARIPSKHDRFATDFIGAVDKNGTCTTAVKLEAWRNADDGTWAIDRLTHVPSLGRTEQKPEATGGLCFFDALYHCARFQATELAGHENRQIVHIPGKRWASAASYREAAEAAGQVIDEVTGLAHPCAHGRILTAGTFSDRAVETAYRTHDVKALPMPPRESPVGRLVSDLNGTTGPVASVADLSIQLFGDRTKQVHLHRDAIKAGKRLSEGLDLLVKRKFRTDFTLRDFKARNGDDMTVRPKAYVKMVITLGLAPALGVMRRSPRYMPISNFNRLKNDFTAAVGRLPDSPVKILCREFAQAAEAAMWFERAARLVADARQPGGYSKSRVAKAMRFVDQGGALADLPPVDIDRLKGEYMRSAIEPRTFVRKLSQTWGECENEVNKHIRQIEKGMLPGLTAP